MSTLEIVLIVTLWALLGVWISWKRDWYNEENWRDECHWYIMFNIILSVPILIVLIIAKIFKFIFIEDLKL